MQFVKSALIYTLAFLVPFIVLLWIGEGKKALVTFILSLTVIGIPVAMILGVVGTYQHRHSG